MISITLERNLAQSHKDVLLSLEYNLPLHNQVEMPNRQLDIGVCSSRQVQGNGINLEIIC